MPQLFDSGETEWSKTAMTLKKQHKVHLSFPRWGNPDRQKINEVLNASNAILSIMRGVF